jgi:hypothetical protein
MTQPKIMLEGELTAVTSVSWNKDGSIFSICYRKKDGGIHTMYYDEANLDALFVQQESYTEDDLYIEEADHAQ